MIQFRFLNIPVTIHPTFWIFLLIFAFDPQIQPWQMLLLGIVFVFSLLFHEYGHALAAQKFGRPPEITLEALGGYAAYDGRNLPENQRFFITLSGPLFTALLIGISSYLLSNHLIHSLPLQYFLLYLRHLNIYWLIVNLAPLEPLDGGKIATHLLQKALGPDRGRKFSLLLGNLIALAGIAYFILNGSYIFAYVFLFYGWKNFQTYKAEYTTQKPTDYVLYNNAIEAKQQNDLSKAQALLTKLIKSQDEYIKVRSAETLAEMLDTQGKKEAYTVLTKVDPHKLGRGKWLLCQLAYRQGNYTLIQKFSLELYHVYPTLDAALLNAKAFSQLGHHAQAIGWLKTALQFEGVNPEALLSDPAFAPLQNHPDFPQLTTLP